MVATIQGFSQGAPRARRAGEDIQMDRNATSSGTEARGLLKKYERKINSAVDRGLACPIYSSALLTDDLRCGTCGGNEAS